MRNIAPSIHQQRREQFQFLEGSRGVAAVQVMLLHFAAFFFPVFARVAEEGNFELEKTLTNSPLFFLADGYTAVYIFFIMSGFVLAQSFSISNLSVSQQAGKRVLRLFIPTAAAGIFAYILINLYPEAAGEAISVTGSTWAASLLQIPSDFKNITLELLLNSMLLGYKDISIFSDFEFMSPWLSPLSESANPPTWTLHAELWGSALTLLMAVLHRNFRAEYFWIIFCSSLIVFGTSHFSLFLIGFAAYKLKSSLSFPPARHVAIPALVAGIYASCIQSTWHGEALISAFSQITLFQAQSAFHAAHMIAAILIFFGIFLSQRLKSLLSHRSMLWVGKISFSIYLLHFPVLFTVGAMVFIELFPMTGYLVASLISFTAYAFTTIGLAWIFEKFIDKNAIRISSRVVRKRTVAALQTDTPY